VFSSAHHRRAAPGWRREAGDGRENDRPAHESQACRLQGAAGGDAGLPTVSAADPRRAALKGASKGDETIGLDKKNQWSTISRMATLDGQLRTGARRRYQVVARQMADAIAQRQWRGGERLADERRLAADFGVSRTTVRLALDDLAQRGLVERLQGRGTFVVDANRHADSTGCLCILAVGPTMRFNSYVATAIALTEEGLRGTPWRLLVRYEVDPLSLGHALLNLDEDPLVHAGILVGEVHRSTLEPIASQLRVRWVKVGDYAEATRPSPVIDHVVGDNYALARRATEHLLELGRRDLALFVLDEQVVWSRDMISAFRTVLDDACVAPERQRVADLADLHNPIPQSPLQVQHRLRDRVLSTITPWLRSGNLPEGVILPRKGLEAWQDALDELGDLAGPLRDIDLVVWDYSERRQMQPARSGRLRVSWVLTSLSAMINDAIRRLDDTSAWGGPEPQRHYHNQIALEPASMPHPRPPSTIIPETVRVF